MATPLLCSLTTTKRVASVGDMTLASGEVLQDVRVGYETYGTLDERRDNAVLVCHYFSGTSHAAGRYSPDEAEPGWWDAVIGPGKAIDTDRYFVVAIEALGCVRIDRPHGVTTGPGSIDPSTGRPYGPSFPALSMADSVEAQRRVLDQLGVGRLAMVAGPSLGAMQALQWAVQRPAEVERVVACIGLAEFQAREIGLYHAMQEAVRLDPKFQNGAYDPADPPLEGLALSLKLMMLLSSGREALNTGFGRRWSEAEDPHTDRTAAWAVEAWLEREARQRAAVVDANAWIAMLRANMRWDLGHGHGSLAAAVARIRARVLLVPGRGDELAHLASYHFPLVEALRRAGVPHEVQTLPAARGHMAGLTDIQGAAGAIAECLAAERPAPSQRGRERG